MALNPSSPAQIIDAAADEFHGIPIDSFVTGSNFQIPEIEDIEVDSTIVPFGEVTNDLVELHISNLKDVLLESNLDIDYRILQGYRNAVVNASRASLSQAGVSAAPQFAARPNNALNNVEIDLHNIFREMGYISGKFKFQLNFHRNVLGDANNPTTIIGISDDRTQVNLLYDLPTQFDISPLVDVYGNRIEYYLNLGSNKLFRISSFIKNTDLSTDSSNVYTITLQEAFPAELGLNQQCWIAIQIADSVSDVLVILPRKTADDLKKLKNPNFSIETSDGFAQSTAFKSWDQLLGSNPTSSQQLINKFISSSFDSIDLNIDYRDYNNFVFYSSAEERLKNFRYKVQLLEYYSGLLNTLEGINPSASEVGTNKFSILTKKNAVLSGLDGYEKYLYFESGSYESSSLGEFFPSTWPKSNSSTPYSLFSVTSSEALAWYQTQVVTASLYDRHNSSALVNLIPDHIRDSKLNDSYATFVNMIAQHFDILWSYVHDLTNVSSRKESLTEGLAKDLIYHVLRSLGIDVVNGFKIEELWLDALGLNTSGSYNQSGSLHTIPNDDISKETFKRILNNLSYLLKTKGTERGIRSLINCYGVPSTVYRIKEFSGPYQYDSNVITRDEKYRKVEKFTYCTPFISNSFVSTITTTNVTPASLQFRFRIDNNPRVTQSLQGPIATGHQTYIYGSTGSWGTASAALVLTDGTTPITIEGPFFNGAWWNFTAVQSGSLYFAYAIQTKYGKIVYGISGSNPVIGGFGQGQVFGNTGFSPSSYGINGAMQEIRYWTLPLDEVTIREHALNPQSITGRIPVTGSNYSLSYKHLTHRYPLGSTLDNFDRTTATTFIESIQPNRSLGTMIATASGFQNLAAEPMVEDYYVWYPNLGNNLDIANKIRIEDAKLDGQLSSYHSVEKSDFDAYSLDSPKVGVYFSPQDEINEDIADQFSGMLLDDILGDPRDDFKTEYEALQNVRSLYNLKFNNKNSFWKYVKLIENFDASMFYLIKKFLPARSVKLVGLVIQPTILDRPKVAQRQIFQEREDLDSNFDLLPKEISGSYDYLESNVIGARPDFSSSYVTYNAIPILVSHTMDAEVCTYTGSLVISIAAIEQNVEYVNDNIQNNFMSAGTFNHRYRGCRISSRDFNIPSNDTPDSKPVVEFWTSSPNNMSHQNNAGGAIQI